MTIRNRIMLLLAASLLFSGSVLAGEEENEAQLEQNKEIVIAFYTAAINEKDFEAASQYLGDVYIQHNPLAADGPEGLKAFIEWARVNAATFEVEFKRVLAEGDFVVVHSHARASPEDRGSAVMDIFRLEDGKVVEHWDVIQAIPETAMNPNGMF